MAVPRRSVSLSLPALDRRFYFASAALLALFFVLTVLVHWRLLAGFDLVFSQGKRQIEGPFLEVLAALTGIAFSAEFSLVYGLGAAILLWRRGLGRWSLAPFGFVAVTPIEMVLKRYVDQPYVPAELHSDVPYPLLGVHLGGAFPSGHALRTAFFLVFVAVLLWRRRQRPAALALLALALFIGYTRVYVGDHWLSDVVAGLTLGAATALPLAAVVSVLLDDRSAR
ncbi:MAG: phosphatase PAP2 family protein [Chloroflexota bacterium]